MEKLFKQIAKNVLSKDSRDEGLKILEIGSKNKGPWEKEINDVIKYYNRGLKNGGHSDFNIICMALDFAKYKLVKENLMEQSPYDSFGNIGWMFQ